MEHLVLRMVLNARCKHTIHALSHDYNDKLIEACFGFPWSIAAPSVELLLSLLLRLLLCGRVIH